MLTLGSRFWLAVTTFAVVAWFVYVLSSGGEMFGTLVLGFLAVAAAIPGIALVVLRDGNVAVEGAGAMAAGPRSYATRFPAAWPALAALGAGVALVGLATGGALLYVGLAILAVTLFEWMVQGWAERATGDPAANQRLRNQVMYPIEIPTLAVIGIGLVVLTFSRVLLALPKTGSTVIAIVVAGAILGVAVLLTSRPRLSSSVLTGVVVAGAVALVAGGIVGAVAGEREIEEHGAGHGGDEGLVVSASNDDGFDTEHLVVPAGEAVTIAFENHDERSHHNLALVDVGDDGVRTPVIGPGEEATLEEVTLEPGEYRFVCEVHPQTMTGVLEAQEAPHEEGGEDEGG